MGSEWREVEFASLCDITRGASPRPIQEWVANEGIPWVKISDATIADSRFIERTSERIRAEGRAKSVPVFPGDLILSNSATPGIPRFVSIEACIHDGWLLLRNFRGIDKLFCYYLLLYERPRIVQKGSGTVFTNLKTEILKRHRVKLPPIPEQRAIAHILGTLDDKIELNRRMNETLEAMARALFKAWFVDFEPVRAKMEGRWRRGESLPGLPAHLWDLFPDRLVDSELGEIPEGWRYALVGNEVEVVKGVSYRSDELAPSEVGLVTLKSIKRGGGYRPDGLKPFTGQYKADQAIESGELIVAQTDVSQVAEVIGKPALVLPDPRFRVLVASLDVLIIRPTSGDLPREFFYLLFLTPEFQDHIYGHTNGTTVLHLSKTGIPTYAFVRPSASVAQAFSEIIVPIFHKLLLHETESRTLAALRDLLLPKLISGQIRVFDAEKFLKERGL
ncbi:MAG: restriction endonuclease subunit S [Anaerolineae bacterium]